MEGSVLTCTKVFPTATLEQNNLYRGASKLSLGFPPYIVTNTFSPADGTVSILTC